jgi:hypothetical protein
LDPPISSPAAKTAAYAPAATATAFLALHDVMQLRIWLVVLATSTTSVAFFAAKAAGGAPVVASATVVIAPATLPRCFQNDLAFSSLVYDVLTLAESNFSIFGQKLYPHLYHALSFGLLLRSHFQCYIGSGILVRAMNGKFEISISAWKNI